MNRWVERLWIVGSWALIAFLIWVGFQLLVGLNSACCEPLSPDVGQL
jgi:hypothetical protein